MRLEDCDIQSERYEDKVVQNSEYKNLLSGNECEVKLNWPQKEELIKLQFKEIQVNAFWEIKYSSSSLVHKSIYLYIIF